MLTMTIPSLLSNFILSVNSATLNWTWILMMISKERRQWSFRTKG